MTIVPSVSIDFLARTTANNVNILDSFRVGITNVVPEFPESCNQVVANEVVFDATDITDWELSLLMGVRSSYTSVESGAVVSPYWRNADGEVVFLSKIYGIVVQCLAHTPTDDGSRSGWTVAIQDAEVLDFGELLTPLPDVVGYVDSVGSVWLQTFPDGLLITSATLIAITPLQDQMAGNFRITLLGESTESEVWALTPFFSSITGVHATNVITATGHTFENDDAVMLPTLTGGGPEIEVDTIYYIGDVSGDTFKLYDALGGSIINFSATITDGSIMLEAGRYRVGDLVTQDGVLFKQWLCTVAHYSSAVFEPGVGGDWEDVWQDVTN